MTSFKIANKIMKISQNLMALLSAHMPTFDWSIIAVLWALPRYGHRWLAFVHVELKRCVVAGRVHTHGHHAGRGRGWGWHLTWPRHHCKKLCSDQLWFVSGWGVSLELQGIYTNAGNCAELLRRSRLRAFVWCCLHRRRSAAPSAAGARRDRSWSDFSAAPAV